MALSLIKKTGGAMTEKQHKDQSTLDAKHEEYRKKLNVLLEKFGCEKKASKALFKSLPDAEQGRINMLVDETTFSRRKYGQSDFYCWANHPVFNKRLVDPWPAVHYPKDVLRIDFALRT